MATRNQLEKVVKEYSDRKGLDHRLVYGRIHGDESHKFWYLAPFGQNSFKLGNTIAEAIGNVEARLGEMDNAAKVSIRN